jgi:prevent-host-death family protein
MKQVKVHEAKANFFGLINEVEAGAVVTITRAGRPVARLSPIRSKGRRRRLGILDGKFRIPEDFNAPLREDILDAIEGRR